MNIKAYGQIKKLLNDCDAIIIGASSGLSSSAGIDYSKESFQKKFPELVKAYGMTDMYTSSFYPFQTEEERWSYWAKHINYSFITPPALKAYQELLEIVKEKDYFVITTNVDGQFLKAGFDQNKVFEVQGSYGKMQCAIACHNKLYDDTKIVKEMLREKDNLKIDKKLVPICPVCKGKMDINVRKDSYFVEDEHWHKLNNAYEKFLNTNLEKKLIFLELGVGFNTPGIIRFPFEQLTNIKNNITLIRVNEKQPEPILELKEKIISIQEDCSQFLKNITNSQ